MTFIDLKHPETAMEVFVVGTLELLLLAGNYVLNGPGPAPLAVIVVAVAITAWILWADYRLIKRDRLYPYAGSRSDFSIRN